jgi:hypothetical protein
MMSPGAARKEHALNRFCILSFAVVLLLAPSPASTQSGAVREARQEVLRNTSVAEMTKAGLSASVIVAKIRSSETDFDVSAAELIRLKQEGIADEVITAMIEAARTAAELDASQRTRLGRKGSAPGAPASEAADAAPTPPESGIYFVRGEPEEEKLVLLEPSVYTQTKETGVWKAVLTQGITKVRHKAVLPGERAVLQIETRRPVFYFFFDVPSAGLSSSGTVWGPTTSANEFVLARMEVKKSRRELTVGERGEYTGRQTGVSGKFVQPFDYERLAPGVYKVTPKADLADGEYCFFFGGSVAASGAEGGPKLFDFGVRHSPSAGLHWIQAPTARVGSDQ